VKLRAGSGALIAFDFAPDEAAVVEVGAPTAGVDRGVGEAFGAGVGVAWGLG